MGFDLAVALMRPRTGIGAAARVVGLTGAALIIPLAVYLSIVPHAWRQPARGPMKTGAVASQPNKRLGGDPVAANSVTLSRAQLDNVTVAVVEMQRFDAAAGEASASPAVPISTVVREEDGPTAVWVMTDLDCFDRRTVRVGVQRDGWAQIVEGLRPGEFVATRGAQLLSNILAAASRCPGLGDVARPNPASRSC